MRIASLLALALATSACGGAMKDGSYLFVISSVHENTCPFDDEALVDFGETSVVVFSDTVILGELMLDRNGKGFSGSNQTTSDGLDPCFVVGDREFDGVMLSRDSFTLDIAGDFHTEGDCSGVDTTGLPCSWDITMTGSALY